MTKKAPHKFKNLGFYILWISIPMIQFFIMYICVNANSLLLAFKSYDIENGFSWNGFKTFQYTLNMIFKNPVESLIFKTAFKNSLISLGTSLLIGVPLSLIFSYFIYKKFFGSKFYRVMLFLPSILSVIVMVAVFRNFVDVFIPEALKKAFGIQFTGFLANSKTRFGTLLFYSVFTSFGTTTLLYSSSMSSIDQSLIESANIDGAKWWDEFIHIVLPSIYPNIVVFVVVAVASVFTNQLNLYSFYQLNADVSDYTLGYYLYRQVMSASGYTTYPYLGALGICFSVVIIPLTFCVRFLLNKLGPSAEN